MRVKKEKKVRGKLGSGGVCVVNNLYVRLGMKMVLVLGINYENTT
jgi:hypothetical protein